MGCLTHCQGFPPAQGERKGIDENRMKLNSNKTVMEWSGVRVRVPQGNPNSPPRPRPHSRPCLLPSHAVNTKRCDI